MPADKNAIIQKAQKYTAKGQIEKAIEEWQKLIAETPNDGNIYNTIGDLYLKSNSQGAAVEFYLKAAETFMKAGFSLKTIAVYKKAIKVDPSRMDAYIELAALNAERGLIGNAIEDYMKVAKHYAKEGKTKESLEIYQRIANLDPTNVQIQVKVSELYKKEGLAEDALAGLLKAAQTCSVQGKTQAAEELYRHILQIAPENQEALTFLKKDNPKEPLSDSDGGDSGLRYSEASNPADSAREESLLCEVAKQPGATPDQHRQLSHLLLKRGDLEGAFHELRQAVDAYFREEQWDVAVGVLQAYLECDPDRVEARELLARSYEKSGVVERAVEEYAAVVDLLMRGEQSISQAMEVFQHVKELDPQNPAVEGLMIRLGYQPDSKTDSKQETSEKANGTPGSALEAPSSEPSQSLQPFRPASDAMNEMDMLQSYLTEAEVYMQYGLSEKALEQLQIAAQIAPDHAEIHLRLKDFYKKEGRVSETVRECLFLARIYSQNHQEPERLQVLQEAAELDPDQQEVRRLLQSGEERFEEPLSPPSSEAGPSFGDQALSSMGVEKTSAEEGELTGEKLAEIEEQFAEAEFYLQQGLKEEAKKLYERIVEKVPTHAQAHDRLSELIVELGEEPSDPVQSESEGLHPSGVSLPGWSSELEVSSEFSGSHAQEISNPVVEEQSGAVSEDIRNSLSETSGSEVSDQPPDLIPSEQSQQQNKEEEGEENTVNLSEMFREDLEDQPELEKALSEEEMAEKELDSIFREFKKGVQEKFGDQDYETHYNLGIAYKEMGLFHEAIEEFQLATKGPAVFIDAMSMIAACYRERGDEEDALRQFQATLQDERCSGTHAIGIKYALAELSESMGKRKEALTLYSEICQVDRSFKDAARKVKELREISDPSLSGGSSPGRRKDSGRSGPQKRKKRVTYL